MGSPLLPSLLLALAPAPAQPAELPGEVANIPGAVRLAPVSEWGVDYDEQRCRLRRLFGSEQQPHLLAIEQSAPVAKFALTIAGNQLPDLDGRIFMQLGLESDRPMMIPHLRLGGTLDGFGRALIWPSVTMTSPAYGEPGQGDRAAIQSGISLNSSRKVERIVVRGQDKEVLVLETGNMQPAIRALNACTVDLIASWGLDPAQHRYYTPPRWVNFKQVRERMINDNFGTERGTEDQAVVEFRFIVETDGSVSDCVRINATSVNSVRPPVCSRARMARFEPALDANGQPMRSFIVSAFSYFVDAS
ncbi:energy transducer TonB [Porphyrobacter sp. AAP82]|uniref:energy transducer TonB n=1 Tax=Porphyrobacter sp. AAP82 TaxID=1248917 RepID=UPI0002EC532D|nr:hypothetical protein [Porphyrobacter sp. AAP82]